MHTQLRVYGIKERIHQTSKQQSLEKHDLKIDDIPKEYNNDPKILAFISSYSEDRQDKDSLITKIQEETDHLVNC